MSRGLTVACLAFVAACGSDGPGDIGPPLPNAVLLGATTNTAQRGMQSGTAYSDACPTGQVVIGYHGFTTTQGFIGQIQAACGTLSIAGGSSPVVQTSAGAFTPLRGGLNATEFTATCPSGQVVVGFGGRSGDLVDRLTVRCAPLLIGRQGATWAIAIGLTSDLTPVGGAGGTAFAQTDCPASSIATTSEIRAATIPEGGVAISAFGLGCQDISLDFP
jgi:hypothetical protein